jgi:hypothetical protein
MVILLKSGEPQIFLTEADYPRGKTKDIYQSTG